MGVAVVTLCDAGPLVALVDRSDEHHSRCVSTLGQLPLPGLVTTWPCLTEAMYLLGRRGGFPPQDELWGFLADGLVSLHVPAPGDWERMRGLMTQYRDTPMDLADASLVVAGERLRLNRVFTVDRHFHAYRLRGRDAFEVIIAAN